MSTISLSFHASHYVKLKSQNGKAVSVDHRNDDDSNEFHDDDSIASVDIAPSQVVHTVASAVLSLQHGKLVQASIASHSTSIDISGMNGFKDYNVAFEQVGTYKV